MTEDMSSIRRLAHFIYPCLWCCFFTGEFTERLSEQRVLLIKDSKQQRVRFIQMFTPAHTLSLYAHSYIFFLNEYCYGALLNSFHIIPNQKKDIEKKRIIYTQKKRNSFYHCIFLLFYFHLFCFMFYFSFYLLWIYFLNIHTINMKISKNTHSCTRARTHTHSHIHTHIYTFYITYIFKHICTWTSTLYRHNEKESQDIPLFNFTKFVAHGTHRNICQFVQVSPTIHLLILKWISSPYLHTYITHLYKKTLALSCAFAIPVPISIFCSFDWFITKNTLKMSTRTICAIIINALFHWRTDCEMWTMLSDKTQMKTKKTHSLTHTRT